jgi:hypothetical protein
MGVATGVDVSSTPWLGASFTSPVRKIEENFFNSILASSGTESGNLLKKGGRVTETGFP